MRILIFGFVFSLLVLVINPNATIDAQLTCTPVSDSVTADVLCVDQNDNIGIGAKEPKAKLHVLGPIQADVPVEWDSDTLRDGIYDEFIAGQFPNRDWSNFSNRELRIQSGSSRSAHNQYILFNGHITNYTRGTEQQPDAEPMIEIKQGKFGRFAGLEFYNDGHLSFLVAGDGDTYGGEKEIKAQRALTIQSTGNIGIGSANPQESLVIEHANAQVRLTAKRLDSNPAGLKEGGDWILGTGWGQIGKRKAFYILDVKSFPRLIIEENGHVGIGRSHPEARLNVEGTTRTGVLEITGGSDLAEPFKFTDVDAITPGMVVAIDPEQPGQLRIADRAYDRRVAGIISGANGIQPGLIMQQEGTSMIGSHPVALTGRVYVLTDASNGSIEPGDLLTTSDVPGHAMKATDNEQAFGATIGKAMSSLDEGRGLVLVLIALQ